MTNPKRGEIWLVQLDPTRGQEIQKTRPAVVISSDLFEPIPIQIVVPVTRWQTKFSTRPFIVSIQRTDENGLEQDSAGNVLQVRSISVERFLRRLGQVSTTIFQEIIAGLIICIDYK